MSIRVVLADDHPLILNGLKGLLTSEEGFEIVSVCTNGDEALDAVIKYKPDILVLDIRMPVKDGIAVLKEIHELALPVKVVLLAGGLNEKEATQSIRMGVKGIILKEMAPQLLISCLRKVYSGGQWMERHSFNKAINSMLQREGGMQEVSNHLTSRELHLVKMVAEGFRNRDIARKLSISEDTVKRHLYNIYQKLSVENRPQLIRYAHERYLI